VLPGWLLEAVGNGGPRGMAIARRRVTGTGNRTRLMGCFGQFIRIMHLGHGKVGKIRITADLNHKLDDPFELNLKHGVYPPLSDVICFFPRSIAGSGINPAVTTGRLRAPRTNLEIS
jgi:hypothetical protein